MATKMTITFDGFNDLAEILDKCDGNLKSATTECLEKTNKHIAPKLHDAMKIHRKTGKTEGSILDDSKVEWSGSVASIDVGFDINNGGLPSIFLMYGTPKMQKDVKLFNAIKGTKTKKEIEELQKEIMNKAISFARK